MAGASSEPNPRPQALTPAKGVGRESGGPEAVYRGRIAPTPTGHLHLGHARAFGAAWTRARQRGGTLLYRTEDLDPHRCKAEFAEDAMRDLRWLGLDWDEGPDVGGPHVPYVQSERTAAFREVWAHLRDIGAIYPSPHSRQDVARATVAPHEEDAELVFPPELRPAAGVGQNAPDPGEVNWRFRVPDGRTLSFEDTIQGRTSFTAGVDFGDFLVWRRDGVPAYELAVVADDHAMRITEVVRGADLLLSTARQLLIYEALGWPAPAWCHIPLVRDSHGRRLAKRHASLSLRTLRETGAEPGLLREEQLAAVVAAGG